MHMPTSGLSLVGFMSDRDQAISHLRKTCVPNPVTKTDSALEADWTNARNQLGAPISNAGHPTMSQIPATDLHIQRLLLSPWGTHLRSYLSEGGTFQMIELAPLLAFQISVDTDRSAQHRAHMSGPP